MEVSVMWDLDRWQEIIHTLSRHKLRTGLTAFGVFWGIFMLVLLLGAGNSLKRSAIDGFAGNTNSIYIWVGSPTQYGYKGFAKGRRVSWNIEDRDMLRQKLNGAEHILEINELGGWQVEQHIVHNQRSGSFAVRGTHAEIAEIDNYTPIKGRYINAYDYLEKRKVVVLGAEVYKQLFEQGEDPVGQSIEIAGINFKIIGVYKSKVASENARRDDERILIPNSTLRTAFNQIEYIGSLRIKPAKGVSAEKVEAQALALLKEFNHVHPKDTGAFGHYNTEKNYLKVVALFNGLNAFSWFVAIGTLLAGVIGVGNIMLIVVKEKTREIGLRKALGATRRSIIGLIIQEALVITSLAGYAGLLAGVLILELFSFLLVEFKVSGFGVPAIDFPTALTALGVLIFAGVMAALLPAYKAAAVNPITALQDS